MKAKTHQKKAWLLLAAGIRQARIAGKPDDEIKALCERLLASETLNEIRPRKKEPDPQLRLFRGRAGGGQSQT